MKEEEARFLVVGRRADALLYIANAWRTHDERMTNAQPTRCLLGSSVERMAPNPRRSTRRRRRENAGASTLRARSACFGMRVRRPPARR